MVGGFHGMLHLSAKCRDHINLVQKSCQVYFLDMCCPPGGFLKGDLMVADIEELEEMDASELDARRLNAEEVLTPMKGEKYVFPIADRTVKTPGGDRRLRTSTKPGTAQTEEKNKIIFEENQKGLLQLHVKTHRGMMMKPKSDLWSISGDFICRHHVEPRVKLYMPREESFPVPLKYIDVTRTTDTTLDVLFLKNIDDYLNVDRGREL